MNRVLRNSLTAYWATGGEMEVFGWVSPIDDGPHTVQPDKQGSIQSLGLVPYKWIAAQPGVPVDLDLSTVNDEPLCNLFPVRLGFVYYDLPEGV